MTHRLFEDEIVTDVTTVREFVEKYYKPDRYTGRGEDYTAVVLASHEKDYAEQGYTIISRHESKTGEVVALYAPAMVPGPGAPQYVLPGITTPDETQLSLL